MGITNPLDAFSKLYAVVLDHDRGGGMRVKWSLEHTAWIRNRDYSRRMATVTRHCRDGRRTHRRRPGFGARSQREQPRLGANDVD